MSTDPKTNNVVMFGGNSDFGSRLNDTWLWNGAAWVNVTHPLGPSARFGHGMAFDPGLGQTVMFGGRNDASVDLADTWVWDGAWAQHVVVGAKPSPRRQHAMAYDPTSGGVILFGGNGATNYNDTWLWTGAAWLDVTPANPADSPPPRFLHSMAFDPTLGKLVVFGGVGNSGELGDTWAWNFALRKWEQLNVTGPSARHGSGFAFDPAHAALILFGGSAGGGETWAFEGGQWTQLFPNNAPDDRMTVTATTHVGTGRLLLFGGIGATRYGDTWVYGTRAEVPSFVYPSDLCSTGDNVVRGRVVGQFVSVATAPDPDGGTAVCVVADDGLAHLGGKVVVNGAIGPPASTDSQATACALDGNNERLQSGLLAGSPYAIDVTPLPAGEGEAAWVCVQLAGMSLRLRFTTANGTGTRFEPDSLVPPDDGYGAEPWPAPAGQPSGDCNVVAPDELAVQSKLVNLRIGEAGRVALSAKYAEGPADPGFTEEVAVCYRAQDGSAFAGGKLSASATVALADLVPTVATDLGPCTFPVFTREQFPSFGIWTSDPNGPPVPASVCAQAAGSTARVTLAGLAVNPAPGVDQDTA